MFQRIANWHRNWEDEILALLAHPELAEGKRPGLQHWSAQRLARLSAIERQQLREFVSRHRGRTGYLALGKLVLLSCLAGGLLHLGYPSKFGLPESMLVCNLLVLATTIGLVGVWFNYRRIPPPSLKSLLAVVALACAGALVGAGIATLVDGKSVAVLMEKMVHILMAGAGAGAVYAALYGLVAAWRNKEYAMLTSAMHMQAEQDRLARQLSEARLRLLQAQIEPHFLFNTLGAVQQLAQTESPRAAALTANLITFLRASLGDIRTELVSLQAEWGLVDAYLKVMQTRLGTRLEFQLNLPSALAGVRIPSMLVLTLVENAIKHGIEPAPRGGRIDVTASEEAGLVRIEVCDTGAGQATPTTLGVGLSNLKERLHLTFGDAAQLHLHALEPSGMLSRLQFPLHAPTTLQTKP